jgi:uncharacterized membrane-anchored protein
MIIFVLDAKKYSESLLTGIIRRENMHLSKAMEAKMEKKIAALKAAYAAKNGAKLRRAAEAVVAHDRKHPFASLCGGIEACETVRLAKRIVEAPALPF